MKEVAPVDVVITPIIDLALPIIGPIIKGTKSALEVTKLLQPQVILPTAAGGDVIFEGLLMSLLRAVGSVDEFQTQLAENNLATRALEPKPGERFELQQRALSL